MCEMRVSICNEPQNLVECLAAEQTTEANVTKSLVGNDEAGMFFRVDEVCKQNHVVTPSHTCGINRFDVAILTCLCCRFKQGRVATLHVLDVGEHSHPWFTSVLGNDTGCEQAQWASLHRSQRFTIRAEGTPVVITVRLAVIERVELEFIQCGLVLGIF